MQGNTGDVGEVREAGEVGEAGEAQREDSWRRPLLGSRGNGRAHKRRGRRLQWAGGVGGWCGGELKWARCARR